MASSLEELLAEEGFRARRFGMTSRSSFRGEALMRSHRSFEKPRRDSSSGLSDHRTRSEGRKSDDISRYILRGELPRTNSSNSSRRSRDNLVSRFKIDSNARKETMKRLTSGYTPEFNNFDSEDTEYSEITEVGVHEDEGVRDIYSGKAYNSGRSENSSELKREKHRLILNSKRNLIKETMFGEENRRSMKTSDASYDSSIRSSKNAKSFEDDSRGKRQNSSHSIPKLALDEVAVKAVVSILIGYIKRFLKDKEFRSTVYANCFSCLKFIENGEDPMIKPQVITNLEQAIEVVENAAEVSATTRDLKKASLQLSMIANLNSNDSKDGFTSGIPNSRLSACAHIYLSVIYKLQKKDRVAAKYLLQVFCDSPFSARKFLLHELWEYLIFPHLAHLKAWYNHEADSIQNISSKNRELKLLNKVYNEKLDSGTYHFAVYYKDWLTEGIESPSLPSIHIPTVTAHEIQPADLKDHSFGQGRPSGPFSPQPMVSKKLYEAVFFHSTMPGICEAGDYGEVDKSDNVATISVRTAVKVKQALSYSSEIVKYSDEEIVEQSSESSEESKILSNNGILSASKEDWKLVKLSASPEIYMNNETSVSNRQEEPAENGNMLHTLSNAEENELFLKKIAKSIFEQQPTQDSHDLTLPHSSEPKALDSYEDISDGTYEYFNRGSFLESTPQDFICPLTGKVFENPVTLETGQTFEQEAIKEWFNQGKRICPVTGKTLECMKTPSTNFILKQVIDSWKLEHCSHLLTLASQILGDMGKHKSRQMDETVMFILEELLINFSGEERVANAKNLISVGGLEFLIRKMKFGDLEEKMRVAALLSCFTEAVASCRKRIAQTIDKQCLLELLQSKQPKSRRNAVLLLTELLCLSKRKDIELFFTGLETEEVMNTMHVLLIYLQNCPPEQRSSVCVLLLHLDLLIEPQKYRIYKEEAVDAIAVALEDSITNDKIRETSCKALHALGGRFSASGKLMTEYWILKQAGFSNNNDDNFEEDDLLVEESFSLEEEEEEEAIDEWLKNLSTSLLGNGKRSFLETMSKCLTFGNSDLLKACLTTIAWLSSSLSALPDAQLPLSAFSALISRLKEILENGEQIEHRVLASVSLLNFSKIPECRVMLMEIAEEIAIPLQNLIEVTWTAKQLYAIISGEYL